MSDLLLIQNAVRDAVRPRRLLIALLLTILPALLGSIWKGVAGSTLDPTVIYDSITRYLIITFTLPILAVVYGTGVVAQELEGRTIVYLLTRPFPRWRILLAKFLVCVLMVFAIPALAILLLALALYGPAQMGQEALFLDLRGLAMGALAYCSLFLLLGTALPKPLIYGLVFVFGWESWVPLLPGQYVRLAIMTYVRAFSAREVVGEPAQNQENFLLALSAPPQIEIPTLQAFLILAAISALCLAASLVIFSVKEYTPKESGE